MSFTQSDKDRVIKRYSERYQEHGYSPKSLGWGKGKQKTRFDILTSEYDFNNKHILDIGCGFGDLNKTLAIKAKNYTYTGIDLVDSFINEAKEKYKDESIKFKKINILDLEPKITYDYCISSGIFNYPLEGDNYEYIELVIEQALKISKDGLAFDFLSDKVDFTLDQNFHNNPEKILSICYKFSKNIILKNNYMPFEFSIFIQKDDSFDSSTNMFNTYK